MQTRVRPAYVLALGVVVTAAALGTAGFAYAHHRTQSHDRRVAAATAAARAEVARWAGPAGMTRGVDAPTVCPHDATCFHAPQAVPQLSADLAGWTRDLTGHAPNRPVTCRTLSARAGIVDCSTGWDDGLVEIHLDLGSHLARSGVAGSDLLVVVEPD